MIQMNDVESGDLGALVLWYSAHHFDPTPAILEVLTGNSIEFDSDWGGAPEPMMGFFVRQSDWSLAIGKLRGDHRLATDAHIHWADREAHPDMTVKPGLNKKKLSFEMFAWFEYTGSENEKLDMCRGALNAQKIEWSSEARHGVCGITAPLNQFDRAITALRQSPRLHHLDVHVKAYNEVDFRKWPVI